jgi:hypothetical protein
MRLKSPLILQPGSPPSSSTRSCHHQGLRACPWHRGRGGYRHWVRGGRRRQEHGSACAMRSPATVTFAC